MYKYHSKGYNMKLFKNFSILKGFSLVELMISLIAISLITAAFAPVVTKKLSSFGISVGSFSGGNSGGDNSSENKCQGKQCDDGYYANSWEGCSCTSCSDVFCKKCDNDSCSECLDGYTLVDGKCVGGTKECRENGGKPSEACCKSVDAMFLPKETTGLSNDLCMMKYNAFDGTMDGMVPSQKGVKLAKVNETCTTGYCCWKGNDASKTSSSCTTFDTVDSYYSGCQRTICQATAATNICQNWAPQNYDPGAWRLPTKEELTAIKNHINDFSIGKGQAGLQLCDLSSASGVTKCANLYGTGGNSGCSVSSGDGGTKDDCAPYRIWGQNNTYLNLSNKTATVGTETDAQIYPKGVRCVTANVLGGTKIKEHKADTAIGEPASQADCDKYNALFISSKYNGNPKGRNICITKFNTLDENGPYYPYDSLISKAGVKVAKRNLEFCSVGSCCWIGVTSGSYTAGNGYSGSSRTLCQATAAEKLCNNYKPTGAYKGAWRLPYLEELKVIGKNYLSYETSYSYFLNQYLYANGLQLCDETSSSGVAKCAGLDGTGSKSGCAVNNSEAQGKDDCMPYKIWGRGLTYLSLSGGMASTGSEANSSDSPKGVRCVTDALLETAVTDQTTDGLDDKKVEKYQKICDKYNALFIPKKYLGTERNICMTKYNALDANGPLAEYTDEELLNISPAVKRITRGTTYCNTGSCCWGRAATSGSYTSNNNMDSTYSGGSRTLCQATAAASLCVNYRPDSATSGYWRLPNLTELKNIATYLSYESQISYFLNTYMGAKGLQLCDSDSSVGVDKCAELNGTSGLSGCAVSNSDSGVNDDCRPYRIWGSDRSYLQLSNGLASTGTESTTSANPKGVRCVTEIGVN